jgi:hypothetical protein
MNCFELHAKYTSMSAAVETRVLITTCAKAPAMSSAGSCYADWVL